MADVVRIPDERIDELRTLLEEIRAKTEAAVADLEQRYGQGVSTETAPIPTPPGLRDDFIAATAPAWELWTKFNDFIVAHAIELVPPPDSPEIDPRLVPSFEALERITEQLDRFLPRRAPGDLPAKQPSTIPNAFPNGVGLVSSGLTMRGVVASIYAGIDQTSWESTDGDVPTFDARRQGGARIFMRGDGTMRRTAELTKLLWEQVHGFSDLDVDVLIAMMAQYLAGPVDADGSVWITATSILDYRGLQPIMRNHDGTYHRHGHRGEDVEAVGEAVGRLAGLWIELSKVDVLYSQRGKRLAKPRSYSHEDRLVNIEGIERFEEHGDLTRAGKWRIKPGRIITDFLRDPNRQVAPIMQKALMYDPYRALFEKRLAVYFAFHRRIARKYQIPLRRRVQDLLEQCRLPIDQQNPKRTRLRFETAMRRLTTDGVLPDWRYTNGSDTLTEKLPRGWLADWLAWMVEIPFPPAAGEDETSNESDEK